MTLMLNMRPPSRPGYHWVAAWNCDVCYYDVMGKPARVAWDGRLDTNDKPLGVLLVCSDACEASARASLTLAGEWLTMPLATFLAQVALTSGIMSETSDELERLAFGQHTAQNTDTPLTGGDEPE